MEQLWVTPLRFLVLQLILCRWSSDSALVKELSFVTDWKFESFFGFNHFRDIVPSELLKT